MNQPSGFLTSATVDQLMEILSPIGTSAAVFEREDNAFRTLAANLEFLEMIGNETFKEEMFRNRPVNPLCLSALVWR